MVNQAPIDLQELVKKYIKTSSKLH